MAETGQIQKLLDRLRRSCSRREYCSSDVYQKALKALDGDDAAATSVVESLKKDGFVDDRRYCEAYSREKSSISGWGAVKIAYMLSAKSISRDVIEAALAEIDGNLASARLDRLLAVKSSALKDDPQRKLKLLRFALGRGYSYDDVKNALGRMASVGVNKENNVL